MAESLCCPPEAITILLIGYGPIYIFFKESKGRKESREHAEVLRKALTTEMRKRGG